ncbi:DUF664 domain-containing protein [Streptomyces sp. NPDC048473]|uniref:mycothiol transferase n=1 Tax=unclassified Streptomyces TaxID=2593676 RepID=UPI00371E7754
MARWKCGGLSEADAHRSVLPSSPHMAVGGVMSHLRWAEHVRYEVVLVGRPAAGGSCSAAVTTMSTSEKGGSSASSGRPTVEPLK